MKLKLFQTNNNNKKGGGRGAGREKEGKGGKALYLTRC